jgi:L-lactate dehydrogenase (cytochrome)
VRGFITVDDARRLARRRVPKAIFDFVDGGAEDEGAVAGNRTGFTAHQLVPRTLVDVSERQLAVDVLGERVSLPVLLAPAGLARLLHPEGELAAARAAARCGTVFALSTGSSCSIEEVAGAGSGPKWFQLYLWKDRDVVANLVERAARSGYRALCLTVDVPMVGQRDRDLRNGMTIPPRITPRNVVSAAVRIPWTVGFLRGRPITFENFLGMGTHGDSATSLGAFVNKEMINPAQQWQDLEWLRELWKGPLAVKGVMHPDDARRAADLGADAVVVSNHGGRQLDATAPTISVLPDVVAAVGERVEVYLDGGVRRGTDVVKALALGARAVLVGRPYMFGLGAAGEEGVVRVLEILRAEVDRCLALLGCPDVTKLDRGYLRSQQGTDVAAVHR